jgi:hypothetical protein
VFLIPISVIQGYSGVTTYVDKKFSPSSAEADFLGAFDLTEDGIEGLDKEGR